MRWSVFFGLGLMVWQTSLGALSHPMYRLAVMVAVLVWAANFVRTPRVG